MVEEARSHAADNRQQGHGRTSEGCPKGLAAGDGGIGGVLHSPTRAIHDEKPIPDPDADRVGFAGSFRVPPEVLDCLYFLVDVKAEERKANTPNIAMREISSRDVENENVLRCSEEFVFGIHEQPRERQPYGYAFMSPYPIPV